MNLLIIDPDMESAKHTESLLSLERFQISKVYTADCVSSAKALLRTTEFTLVISEIILPDGDGQELAVWMNVYHPRTALLFVTAVQDFEIARNALNLGVKGYLNKPVDKNLLALTMEQALLHNTPAQRHDFWQNIIYNECYITPHILQRFGLTQEEKEHCTPVLFRRHVKRRYFSLIKDSFINFTLQNIIAEILLEDTHKDDMIVLGNFVIVLCTGKRSHYDIPGLLEKKCHDVLEFCDISCYLSGDVTLDQVFSCVNALLQFESQDICKQNKVINISSLPDHEITYQRPDIEVWVQHLFSANRSEGLAEILDYLEKLNVYAKGAQKALRCFQTDLIQEISRILTIKNVNSHLILENNCLDELLPVSTNSIEDMKNWLDELMIALGQVKAPSNLPHSSIVEKVKDYISKNLYNDINRSELASLVYMHPDSLSHIFKVQTGMSVTDYILQERLKTAKVMLMTTEKKISDIAIDAGYDNVAYFIKIFKKNTGATPREYRRQLLAKIS